MNSTTDFNINVQFLEIESRLCDELSLLEFKDPVCYVYNPLTYARNTHENYINKYCNGKKGVLFLGMNPGPFGMVQNGVPFGECNAVKNWLKIEGIVEKPSKEHPNRPIQGLACSRSEVSGRRFWNFIQEQSKEPEIFFKNIFVHNYCPLAFLAKSGKNITPPDLKVEIRNPLLRICDEYLCEIIDLLGVHTIIGIGKFAAQRTEYALKERGKTHLKVYSITHPSPVNPAANKGWEQLIKTQLLKLDLLRYFTCDS